MANSLNLITRKHAHANHYTKAMENKKIAIFGTSGFAKEVKTICLSLNYKEVLFISKSSTESDTVRDSEVSKLSNEGYKFTIGIGNNNTRKKVYSKFSNLNYANLIHPKASIPERQLENIKNKEGNIITSGFKATVDIDFGDFGIFNLNSTIGHDCVIGDFVNLAPGVNVSGNVQINDGAYVGTNACILQGTEKNRLKLGSNSVVGAGAVVTKDVEKESTVVGIPAKSL